MVYNFFLFTFFASCRQSISFHLSFLFSFHFWFCAKNAALKRCMISSIIQSGIKVWYKTFFYSHFLYLVGNGSHFITPSFLFFFHFWFCAKNAALKRCNATFKTYLS
jgi:hypothetical protein